MEATLGANVCKFVSVLWEAYGEVETEGKLVCDIMKLRANK